MAQDARERFKTYKGPFTSSGFTLRLIAQMNYTMDDQIRLTKLTDTVYSSICLTELNLRK